MSMEELLFGLLSFVTHVIESITGFGSTVLALPFGIAIAGVSVAVPVLCLHAWLLSAYVVATDFQKIQWKQYGIVMLFVLLGMPIGMWAFSALPEMVLKSLLAVFMILVAANGIRQGINKTKSADTIPQGFRKYILYFLLFLGGVVHGAFSSGGPLLIIYITRTIHEKSQFRATMCSFWFSLNLILLIRYIATGVFTGTVLRMSLITLPFLAAGILLGTWIHQKIPNRHFLLMVYIILLLSGCFMAYSSLPALIAG